MVSNDLYDFIQQNPYCPQGDKTSSYGKEQKASVAQVCCSTLREKKKNLILFNFYHWGESDLKFSLLKDDNEKMLGTQTNRKQQPW